LPDVVLIAGEPDPVAVRLHAHVAAPDTVNVCVPPGAIVALDGESVRPAVTVTVAELPHWSVSVTMSVPALDPAV
jgi:hypothetical protein